LQLHGLRRLRYFVTVAEELHFGRAAQRLHMAQQPLSAQVRVLEREIGHDLFERYANRIRLTPAGTVFLSEAQAILERSASAVELARRAAEGEIGNVRIGYCSTAAERVLPATMRALKAAYPAIGFDLHQLNQREQLRALEHDELDLGFVYRPVDARTFASLDVMEERLVVAVAVDHRLAHAERIPPADLAQEPLVLFSRDGHPVFSAMIDETLRAASIATVAAFSARDATTALALVANGLGVAFLPEHTVVPRRDVSYVPLDTPARLQFAAVWSALAQPRLLRQRFLDALIATLPDLRSGTPLPVPSGQYTYAAAASEW